MRTWYLFVDDVDGLYIYVYMYIDRYTNECGRTLFVVSIVDTVVPVLWRLVVVLLGSY